MRKTVLAKALSLLLCLCAVMPSAASVAFAEETTDVTSEEFNINAPHKTDYTFELPKAVDTVWEKDYTVDKTSGTQTYKAEDGTSYSAQISVGTGSHVPGEGIQTSGVSKKRFSVTVTESAPATSFLQGYDDGCVMITAVVNFSSFPAIIDESYPHPLSLITWTSKVSSSHILRYVCLDASGYLCDNNRKRGSEEAKLTANQDAVINVIAKTEGKTCQYDVYLDGKYMFSGTDTAIPTGTLSSSVLRFGDTQCTYEGYLRSFSVQTVDENYNYGDTPTADWTAYQTTPVTKDADGREVFDIRLISLLDSRKHAAAGYEVMAAYRDQDGDEKVKVFDQTTDTVFTSLNQTVNGEMQEWTASENGGEYIHAMAVYGVYADLEGMELSVRPYVTNAAGNRVYGTACVLHYSGKDANGYPTFTKYDRVYKGVAFDVTEDTYVRYGKYKQNNYDGSETMELKYDGSYNDYTRTVFLKFDISDVPESTRYEVSLNFKSGPGAGKLRLTAVDAAMWDASTLTAEMVKDSWNTGWNTEFPYSGMPYADITEYVKSAKKAGLTEISFRLDFAERYVSSATLYALENGSKYAQIVCDRSYFSHDFNLEPVKNIGYDPWDYAEKLVADWEANIYPIYEESHTSAIVDSSKSQSDYNGTIMVSTNATPPSSWTSSLSKNVRTVSSINGYTALTQRAALDAYGGLASDGGKYYTAAYKDSVTGTPGYFGTYYDSVNDRWWFITPEGNRYIAIGMCSANSGTTAGQKALALDVYGDKTWQKWTSDLFNQYGINTTSGGVSAVYNESELAAGKYNINTHGGVSLVSGYGKVLGTNASIGGSTVFSNNNTINVFDPDFVNYAYTKASTDMAAKKDDPNRMGWTSDNEIPANSDLLDRYLTLDSTNSVNAFSYATAWTWLKHMTGKNNPSVADAIGTAEVNMGGTVKSVSYRDLFRGFVYYRYYAISAGAIKAAAPNQLYLGCRELQNNYQCETVMRVAGEFCDVVTLNLYLGIDPDASVVANIHEWAGKPIYVTEFYAKAMGTDASGNAKGVQSYGIWEYVDADGNKQYCLADGKTTYTDADGQTQTAPEFVLNNTRGAGKVVLSQADRGAYYQTFAIKMLESGYCVGWSWYRYQDNDMTIYLKDGEYVENSWTLQEKANAGTLDSSYVVVHKGESDQSNLDSNKGIVNNAMQVYTEFAESIGQISKNVYSLAEFFDANRR